MTLLMSLDLGGLAVWYKVRAEVQFLPSKGLWVSVCGSPPTKGRMHWRQVFCCFSVKSLSCFVAPGL